MIIITNVSDKYFSLNGVNYAKIYQPLKQGVDSVGIVNIYDTRSQIVTNTKFDEFQIDNQTFTNQNDLITALLDVIFEAKIASEILVKVEDKTDKGGYTGTSKDLKDEIDSKAFEGLVTYQTKTELDAVDPFPSEGTPAKVANDPTFDNNGYYSVVSGVWVKDIDLYESTVNENNTSKAVSGKAVFDELKTLKDLKANLVSGKNLFDVSEVIYGYKIELDGTINVNASHNVSGYIPVEEGDYVTPLSITLRTIVFFDSQKQVLPSTLENVTSFTIPSGVSFIRVTLYSASDMNTVQIEKGNVRTVYESFYKKLKDEEMPVSYEENVNRFNLQGSYDELKLNADSFYLPSLTLWRKITVTEVMQFAGVEINILGNDFGKVWEFGIFDSLGNRITSTGIQEIETGKRIYPLEDYDIKTGDYYLAFFTNSTTSSFAYSKEVVSESSSLVSVLPNTKPSSIAANGFVSYKLIENKPNYLPSDLEEYTDGTIRVLGANGSQPWAWDTLSGKMVYSVSSGASWIDAMPITLTWGWSPIDLVTDGNNIYVLMFDFTILKSSDMTAAATWSNITPPNKNVDAQGFPYCLNIWNGYLYAGEYSGALPLATPPKLHKMQLSTGTWSVSKQFNNGKHIHAVQSFGSAVMYVVVGDATYGTDVGIHRITSGNQSSDIYEKVTFGETLPYPVNLEIVGTKLFGSGDQPPTHIISMNEIGSLGNFRLNPKNFKESASESGETCRAIKSDTEGNLYYLAVETPTSHALYVSPPPYIHRFKISDVINDTGVNGRTVRSGDYFMNYEMRWKKVTFKYKRY